MFSTKDQINRELLSIYFLDSKEIKELMSKIENLPENALKEILAVIIDSSTKQKEYFNKMKKIDPAFLNSFKSFLEYNETMTHDK